MKTVYIRTRKLLGLHLANDTGWVYAHPLTIRAACNGHVTSALRKTLKCAYAEEVTIIDERDK